MSVNQWRHRILGARRAPVADGVGRRRLLRAGVAGGVSVMTAAAPWTRLIPSAHAADHRALVVVFLNGANDGNDTLVPLDARYDDYARGRGTLAIPKADLAPIAASAGAGGDRYGMHPGLAKLVPIHDAGRLAWIANVGPLLAPLSIDDARAGKGLPPYLMSHPDQVAATQGWLYGDEQSGWGGRAIEALPTELRGALGNLSLSPNAQLVTGQSTLPKVMGQLQYLRYWGAANLQDATDLGLRTIRTFSAPDFADPVEAAYAKLLGESLSDTARLAGALPQANPGGAFPATEIGNMMRDVAQILSVRNQIGAVRQVIMVDWGTFDSHGYQRGSEHNGQDGQLAALGDALRAFDDATRALGVSAGVTTLVMTEMGRTLTPSGEGGSDHAWGNHWFVFGDAVKGGRMLGTFPRLIAGGPDDFDIERRGRWLPSIASDQVAASLIRWLGVPADALAKVLPNLAAFAQKTLDLMNG